MKQSARGKSSQIEPDVRQCLALKQMKRLVPTSLALLLVMGSLGNVWAAAFCPRMAGRDCCVRKATTAQRSKTQQHKQCLGMDTITHQSMSMNDSDMPGMSMDNADVSPTPFADPESPMASTSEELASANSVDLPLDACPHCANHSGLQNAPVSSISVADQSNKDLRPVLLPVSRFLVRPAIALAPHGLPREHAPPGSDGPRFILINVFLI